MSPGEDMVPAGEQGADYRTVGGLCFFLEFRGLALKDEAPAASLRMGECSQGSCVQGVPQVVLFVAWQETRRDAQLAHTGRLIHLPWAWNCNALDTTELSIYTS